MFYHFVWSFQSYLKLHLSSLVLPVFPQMAEKKSSSSHNNKKISRACCIWEVTCSSFFWISSNALEFRWHSICLGSAHIHIALIHNLCVESHCAQSCYFRLSVLQYKSKPPVYIFLIYFMFTLYEKLTTSTASYLLPVLICWLYTLVLLLF